MLIARALTDQIIDNAIDLDPEYQRGKLSACGTIAGVVAGSDGAHAKKMSYGRKKSSLG